MNAARVWQVVVSSVLVAAAALAIGVSSHDMSRAAAQSPPVAVDLVLHGGRVVTLDDDSRIVEAVAIQGDRIVGTGTSAEMRALATPRTRVVDLRGRMVIPGLADGHLHSKILGIGPGTVDLIPIRSMKDLLDAIAAQVAKSGPGDLITTTADWHEAQITLRPRKQIRPRAR